MVDKIEDDLNYEEVAALYRAYEDAFDMILESHSKLHKQVTDLIDPNLEGSAPALKILSDSTNQLLRAVLRVQAARRQVAKSLKDRGAIEE